MLDFRIAWAMNMDTPGDTIILGTEGGLRIPSTECWNGEFDAPLKIYKTVAGKEICYEIPMEQAGSFTNLFYLKLRSFIDAVRDGTKPVVTSAQILYNQAIIDGIVKSNALGREIQVEIPEI